MNGDADSKWMRRTVLATLSVVLVVPLAGCTPEAQIFARLQNGELAFLVCESFDATRISVSTADPSSQDYTDVWAAEGGSSLSSGTVITFDAPPNGMTSGKSVDIDTESKKVEIAIDGTREDGTQGVLVAVFSAGRITEDAWTGQTSLADGDPC